MSDLATKLEWFTRHTVMDREIDTLTGFVDVPMPASVTPHDLLRAAAQRLRELEEVVRAVADYRPSVSRATADKIWRGFTTHSGYAPVPSLNEDAALCDLIQFDELRKRARRALTPVETKET